MGIITALYALDATYMTGNQLTDVLDVINGYAEDSILTKPLVYDKLSLDKTYYEFTPFCKGIASYIPADVYRGGRQTNINYKGMDAGWWLKAERMWVLQVGQAFWDGEDRESPRPVTLTVSDLPEFFGYVERGIEKRLANEAVWKMDSGDQFTRQMVDYVYGHYKNALAFLLKAHTTGRTSIIQVSA